ncbi:MAG: hypothetical protein JWO00_515 [Candidatus Parcubacteria bacterium]|nr:hypothetical protein [Candidatus Parcubacteria bacterium]
MTSWSKRRRLIYAGIVIFLLIAVVGIPSFLFFYKAPTCFDGRRNGNEQDVDCGGSCSRLCPSAFLSPAVSWTRFEEVAPHIYNVAAYVVNPNSKVRAEGTPYLVTLYDAQAVPIAEVTGTFTIPAGRNTLAFKASVNTGIQTPARASMKFTGVPAWAYDTKPTTGLSVTDQNYIEGSTTSSLIVTLANKGAQNLSGITVYVILQDKDKNAVGFSKTIVDSIPSQGSAIAPFTWPQGHNGKVVSIEVLPVAE